MSRRMKLMVFVIVIFFGLVLGWDIFRERATKQFFATFEQPPMTVSSAKVVVKSWQPVIRSIGVLQAINGVNISAETSGIVTQIAFTNGQMVKQGELLIKLNDGVEQADLSNAQAQAKLALLDFKRQTELFSKKATPSSQLDLAKAKYDQAQALVDKTQVLIAQKNIRAPFAGKIGIAQVNLGQYVSSGTALVTLQALDSLKVEFSVPEQHLKDLSVGQAIRVQTDSAPKVQFNGAIVAVNATSDPTTHNILVQATIPNQQQQLYPGLFAEINILLPLQPNVVTVPQTALTYSLFGDSVYVVQSQEKDKTGKPILRAVRRYVKTGEEQGNEVVITDGLKGDEEVVTSGQQKLQNNTRIVINNKVQLSN